MARNVKRVSFRESAYNPEIQQSTMGSADFQLLRSTLGRRGTIFECRELSEILCEVSRDFRSVALVDVRGLARGLARVRTRGRHLIVDRAFDQIVMGYFLDLNRPIP